MRKLRVTLVTVGLLASVLVLALALAWPALLRHFTYMARPLAAEHRSPKVWGYAAEEVAFRSADGTNLHGWLFPSSAPEASRCGAVLFLHGNAGNVSSQAGFAPRLVAHGFDVLVFDYRGYGLSEGVPSEEGLYQDAEAAYVYLREERGYAAEEVLLVGHSLGSAVASELAVRRRVAGLVSAAPFTSFHGALRVRAPWFPTPVLRWNSEHFDALSDVQRLSLPVLMALGTEDRLVPRADARALFDAAPEPKQWVDTRGGHNHVLDAEEFHRAFGAFVQQQFGCDPPR